MKILHTADWHIGKRLDRFPRIDEQRLVLAEIAAIADRETVDLVVVAGDLYDAFNPGSEAEELLYAALSQLSDRGRRPVLAIAGNHDSPDRVLAPDILARRYGIVLVGYPAAIARAIEATEEGVEFSLQSLEPGLLELRLAKDPRVPVRIVTTPYANEYRLREAFIPEDESSADDMLRDALAAHWGGLAERHLRGESVNLLVTHLFFAADTQNAPDEPESERPIGHVGGAPPLSPSVVPPEIQYVACGHLHRPHTINGSTVPVRYPGSPLSYSFSEAAQDKSVTIVDVDARGTLGAVPDIRTVPLTEGFPLLRHTASDVPAAIAWLQDNQDSYVELTLRLPDYLSGTDWNALHRAHPRLVTIVPIVEGTEPGERREQIDPAGDITTLFAQYFLRTHGVPPSEEIAELFREILGDAGETVGEERS